MRKASHASLSLLVVLVVLTNITQASSAKAIFGFSECEKLKSRIVFEEKIGKSLWEIYVHDRSENNKTSGTLWNSEIYKDLISIYESDIKVQKEAVNHPKCFTPKQNAYLRQTLSSTQDSLVTLKKNLAKVASGKYNWTHSDFKFYYDKYLSIYEVIKNKK